MIMITGGGGFLGLNIAHAFARRGESVLLVQRHAVAPHPLLKPYWEKQVQQAAGNVLDWPFLFGLVKQYSIESIVHGAFDTAAITEPSVLKNGLHQLVQVELEGSRNLLEITRIAGLRRLTFISSVDCYRGWPEGCKSWDEDACLPPVSFSPIGNCKRAVEQLGFLYSKISGISFVSLRVGRVYGPGASTRHPIRMMVESAVQGIKADLSTLPQSTRMHPVYAEDVGEATRLIHQSESLHHYIYNVSDGSNPAMLEIANTIRNLIPSSEIILGPAAGESAPYSEVANQRMKQEFGFEFRDLKAGIQEYIRWVRGSSNG